MLLWFKVASRNHLPNTRNTKTPLAIAYPFAQTRQNSNQQWTELRARVGHVSSLRS